MGHIWDFFRSYFSTFWLRILKSTDVWSKKKSRFLSHVWPNLSNLRLNLVSLEQINCRGQVGGRKDKLQRNMVDKTDEGLMLCTRLMECSRYQYGYIFLRVIHCVHSVRKVLNFKCGQHDRGDALEITHFLTYIDLKENN